MSALQIGLVVAGAVVLAGVVAHSTWTSRRNAPRQAVPERADEPARAGPHAGPANHGRDLRDSRSFGDDVDTPRTEPTFDGDLALPEEEAREAPLEIAPPPIERKPRIDALIDVIAPIALDAVVSGDAALAALPATRRAGSKPFAVEGLNEATGAWEPPAPGQRYGRFQAAVQLANRAGALNEIEYSEFVVKAQAFADAVGGAPEFPEMLDEVARARELDQFASDHDAQLGFSLRALRSAWSPGYVQQHAARLGFVPGSLPGRMVLPASAPGLPPVLGLSFDTQAAMADDPTLAAIREITLSLDVPQVDRAEQPFVRLRSVAAALGEAMDGIVADGNGQPLAREAMDVIGADLERLYDTLDARDLSAGSALARRLFS